MNFDHIAGFQLPLMNVFDKIFHSVMDKVRVPYLDVLSRLHVSLFVVFMFWMVSYIEF